jgi:quinol-cytochrome oxidoreductase complex cytochrome b subunit
MVVNTLVLGWIGAKPPEGLYLWMGRIATAYYFVHFLVIYPLLSRYEKAKNVPEEIS